MTIHEWFLLLIGVCLGFLLREYLPCVHLPSTVSELERKNGKEN